MSNSQDSNCKSCGTVLSYGIAITGAFLIVAALVWAMSRYTQPAPLGEDRAAARKKALEELRASNAEVLHNYAWQDPVRGVVRLPIEQAMKLAEQEWKNPAQARTKLNERVAKATAPLPKAPEKPSQFE